MATPGGTARVKSKRVEQNACENESRFGGARARVTAPRRYRTGLSARGHSTAWPASWRPTGPATPVRGGVSAGDVLWAECSRVAPS
jgi:hypothetical protein